MEKTKSRELYKKIRVGFSFEYVKESSGLVFNNLIRMEELKNKKTFLMYLSIRKEISIDSFIDFLIKTGKTVYVPYVEGSEIRPVEIKELNTLEKGKFGIRVPQKKEFLNNLKEIEAALVPGILFDARGYRIGYGGGYYDRFLKKLNCLKIGITYEETIEEEISNDKWDIKCDYIVTPLRIIKIE